MSLNPLVSIALCTFNGEPFLREQLDSLVKQTYDNIEIIAVDDQSTDQTLSILNEYKAKYSSMKVYQNEVNLGFRENFETALLKCSGEYIALSDQDDIWCVDKIKIQIENIAGNILIYHDSAFVNEAGIKLNQNISDIINMYCGNQCYFFLFGNCLSGHSCLFHKSLLKDILPLPASLYHDKWLGFVASFRGNVNYINKTLVNYRQHSNSNTDILGLKKSKKQDSLSKITQLNTEINTFQNFLPNDPFINRLNTLLKRSLKQYICLDLFLFVYRNRGVLMYFKKKSAISKLNHCLKFLWGYRLKKALQFGSLDSNEYHIRFFSWFYNKKH